MATHSKMECESDHYCSHYLDTHRIPVSVPVTAIGRIFSNTPIPILSAWMSLVENLPTGEDKQVKPHPMQSLIMLLRYHISSDQ